jgi:DNA repair exonuclease SbcCD ATPase subunit
VSRLVHACGIAIALASPMLLTGCDEPIVQTKIEEASRELATLGAGSNVPASATRAEQVYSRVQSMLREVEGSGTPAQNAAIDLLLAQVDIGRGSAPATRLAELEADALRLQTLARAHLANAQQASSIADSLASVDSAPYIAEVEREGETLNTEIVQHRARVKDFDDQIASLRKEADDITSQASERMQEYGRLQMEASQKSAQEAAEIARQMRGLRREADALNLRAAELRGAYEQLQPQRDEAALLLQQTQNQLAAAIASREELQARARERASHAGESRAAAQAARVELERVLRDLSALREGDLATTADKAASAFKSAASLARKAQSADRGGANLAVGQAQAALGDVLWTRAKGLATQEQLYATIAETLPGVAGAADTARALRTARAKDVLPGAIEAYEAAASALQAAGAKGDAQARFEDVQGKLEQAVAALKAAVRDAGGTVTEDAGTSTDATNDASANDDTNSESGGY